VWARGRLTRHEKWFICQIRLDSSNGIVHMANLVSTEKGWVRRTGGLTCSVGGHTAETHTESTQHGVQRLVVSPPL
jgi:hypothetical protein